MPLTDDTRRRLAVCSSATLSTQLFKRGLRNQVLQGVSRLTPKAPTMVGEAFTLCNIPAREEHAVESNVPVACGGVAA